MSWLPILALAAAAFLVAAFLLKLPRNGWTMFGAAMVFGLAGYAMQGSPGYPGAPKTAAPQSGEANFAMIAARRVFFEARGAPSRFVTIADGFARNGQYENSAKLLSNAVKDNPRDLEAWVALGNALVEHADGSMTPAAEFAYARADTLSPDNPAGAYFNGIGLLRSGRPQDARDVWAGMLAKAPADAPWRDELADRIARLDMVLDQMDSAGP